MSWKNLFIARQAIYDRSLEVIGYELLYRHDDVDIAEFDDGTQASSEILTNLFMHVGIDQITGSALSFVNVTDRFLIDEYRTPMFSEQTVLEVLEDVKPTEAVINGIVRLKKQGYRIALDDFRYADNLVPLLELADFVKCDVQVIDEAELKHELELLHSYNLKLIAEKVETQEKFELCQSLGFDFFQGYFFCRPQLLKRKSIPSNKLVVLNLLKELQNPDLALDNLEMILAQDVSLSYKLLRYINSAGFSPRREVESIKDAILLIGIDTIKNWAAMMLMSQVIEEKPQELILAGMVRARMCEKLAEKLNPSIKPQMFIVGLFSILDALFDTPMDELLDNLILSTPIKLALLDYEGEQGHLLQRVLWYQKGEWDALLSENINVELFLESYVDALKWADESVKAIA